MNVRSENDSDIVNAFADLFKSVFDPNTDYDKNDEFKSNCIGDLVNSDSVEFPLLDADDNLDPEDFDNEEYVICCEQTKRNWDSNILCDRDAKFGKNGRLEIAVDVD
ncbi:hypothetical protein AVEN_239309-1 [Araneus ventricosus]|uniref:Uncharacterized protein n=1 Tax=Araneus ventricosus TaxID=182803 RepID=A0A4Y2M673_ARAVE|nr:hypothetical protein AVEN_239309-1 [Araneus ventricosus]